MIDSWRKLQALLLGDLNLLGVKLNFLLKGALEFTSNEG